MGTLLVHYLDDENKPVIYSTPPHSDPDGYEHKASVTIKPWGPSLPPVWEPNDPTPPEVREPEKAAISLTFTIDEAEIIARRLVEVVMAAREGRYSEEGIELIAGIEKSRLDDAWEALGMKRPDDD